jgi:cytochrome c oxidase subunit 3
MVTINTKETARLHPHKFLIWVAIGSICMMFAGLTSAYIVKKSQDNVINVSLPNIFWMSTVVILMSSLAMHLAVKSIKAKEMQRYRLLLGITALLGVVFAALQIFGFKDLQSHGIKLVGRNSNPGASFLLVIIGLHAIHVLGGVIALLIMYFKIYFSKIRNYSSIPVEVMATYWHFVDALWIYLLIFLMYLR